MVFKVKNLAFHVPSPLIIKTQNKLLESKFAEKQTKIRPLLIVSDIFLQKINQNRIIYPKTMKKITLGVTEMLRLR